MTDFTIAQIKTRAAFLGANITPRADKMPAFLQSQFDALPEPVQAYLLEQAAGNQPIKRGDLFMGMVSGALNLSSAETDAFLAAASPSIPSITKRQFLIQAVQAGIITAEDAESGAIPTSIAAIFDSLPLEQKIAARITWANMTTIERGEPLVAAAAVAFGMTESQIDNFFLKAATL